MLTIIGRLLVFVPGSILAVLILAIINKINLGRIAKYQWYILSVIVAALSIFAGTLLVFRLFGFDDISVYAAGMIAPFYFLWQGLTSSNFKKKISGLNFMTVVFLVGMIVGLSATNVYLFPIVTKSVREELRLYKHPNGYYQILYPRNWKVVQKGKSDPYEDEVKFYSVKRPKQSLDITIGKVGPYKKETAGLTGLPNEVLDRFENALKQKLGEHKDASVNSFSSRDIDPPITKSKGYAREVMLDVKTASGLKERSWVIYLLLDTSPAKTVYVWNFSGSAEDFDKNLSLVKRVFDAWSLEE